MNTSTLISLAPTRNVLKQRLLILLPSPPGYNNTVLKPWLPSSAGQTVPSATVILQVLSTTWHRTMYILAGPHGQPDLCGAATAHAVQIQSSGEVWNLGAQRLMGALECIPRCGWTRFSRCCHPRFRRRAFRVSMVAVELLSPAAAVLPAPQPRLRVLLAHRQPQQGYLCGDNVEESGIRGLQCVLPGLAHTPIRGTHSVSEIVNRIVVTRSEDRK